MNKEEKRFRLQRFVFGLMFFAMIFCLCSAAQVSAASKVAKVTSKRYTTSSSQYTVIYGKTSSGKTVWKFKCGKATQTELTGASFKMQGNYVYILEAKKFIRLNKQTGKVAAQKKNSSAFLYGAAMKVDSKGNVYAVGFYDDYVYKFNKNGKILWKRKINTSCICPYKVSLSGNKLTVYFAGDMNFKYYKAAFKASTGKVIKYYKK